MYFLRRMYWNDCSQNKLELLIHFIPLIKTVIFDHFSEQKLTVKYANDYPERVYFVENISM